MQCNGIINIQTYSGKQHWEPWELPISKSTEKNKKNPAYPTIASTVVAVSQTLLSPRCRPLHIFIKSTQCQCRKGPRRPPQAQLAIVWNLPGSFCGSQNTTPTPMVATPHFRIRIKWLNVYMYIIWDCNKPSVEGRGRGNGCKWWMGWRTASKLQRNNNRGQAGSSENVLSDQNPNLVSKQKGKSLTSDSKPTYLPKNKLTRKHGGGQTLLATVSYGSINNV